MTRNPLSALVAVILSMLGVCASAQIVTDGSFTNNGAVNGNDVYTNGGFNNAGVTIAFWHFRSTTGNGTVAPLHAAPLGTTNGSGIILSSQSTANSENGIVEQSINVVNNALYTLTFDYQSTTGVVNGGLRVFVNGVALAGSPLPGTLTLTHETLTFTATTTGAVTLTFENNHTNNSSKASVEFNNIVITTTPEPSSVMAVTLLLVGVVALERRRFGRVLQKNGWLRQFARRAQRTLMMKVAGVHRSHRH